MILWYYHITPSVFAVIYTLPLKQKRSFCMHDMTFQKCVESLWFQTGTAGLHISTPALTEPLDIRFLKNKQASCQVVS